MARKPTSWSIKGIKEDTRNIARAAAEREEQTIGSGSNTPFASMVDNDRVTMPATSRRVQG